MEMTELFQKLCHMYPESGIGAIGLGSVILHQKEFVLARELLQKGIKIALPMADKNSFAILDYIFLNPCRN